jgi:hypothetical protein
MNGFRERSRGRSRSRSRRVAIRSTDDRITRNRFSSDRDGIENETVTFARTNDYRDDRSPGELEPSLMEMLDLILYVLGESHRHQIYAVLPFF